MSDGNKKKHSRKVGQRVTTIADLSEHTGLSKSTVSRALSGYSDISKETKQRVQDAAKKLGYHPSAIARSIKTGTSQSAAIILPQWYEEANALATLELIEGISNELLSNDWTLTVCSTNGLDSLSEIQRLIIQEKRVDGCIIPAPATNDSRIEMLTEFGVPFVTYGHVDGLDSLYCDVDIDGCIANSLSILKDSGHTRIAFVELNKNNIKPDHWLHGFHRSMSQSDLTVVPGFQSNGSSSVQDAKQFAQVLLSSSNPPTAFLCASDTVAFGVYAACRELGIPVGDQVSVIGFGNHTLIDCISPGLTSYSVDYRKSGSKLANLLLDHIQNLDAPRCGYLEEAVLVRRESVGHRDSIASS
ncbi:LacI family DNA-binding transcriptional regulator [Ruegeria profundi]|uniref:LacI family DNA-binding transcriptional regulator n=1 Tax=Ruegeria profundi TaxID=1685378 RepID=UPI00147ABCB4